MPKLKKHLLPSPRDMGERQIIEAISDIEDALGAEPSSVPVRPGWVPLDGREHHAWPLDDYIYSSGNRGTFRDLCGRGDMIMYETMGQSSGAPFLSRCLKKEDNATPTYGYADSTYNTMSGQKGAGWALSFWFRKTAASGRLIVGYIDNLGATIFGITVNATTNDVQLIVQHSIGGTQSVVTPFQASLNKWHHVALCYVEAGSRPYVFFDGDMYSPGGLAANDTVNWGYGTAPSRWFVGYPLAAYSYYMVSDVRVHATSRMTTDPGETLRGQSGLRDPDPVGVGRYWSNYWREGLRGMSSGIPLIDPIGRDGR